MGVATEKRIDLLPNVPTIDEDVPGLVMISWLGVFAPAKTPKPIIDAVNTGLLKMLMRDDLRAQFVKSAFTVAAKPDAEAFQKFVATDYARYGKLIKERGITVKE